MGQLLNRQIKRMHIIPIWNNFKLSFDFYKRIRKSGRYGIVPSPNHPVEGPGIIYERVLALKSNESLEAKEEALKQFISTIEKQPEQPGFFKIMYNKFKKNIKLYILLWKKL